MTPELDTARAAEPLAGLPTDLYRAQWTFVCRALGRFGVPAHAVEDAAQDVFCIAHRRWADYAEQGELRAWLTAIARRVAFRHRRGAERRLARAQHVDDWSSRIKDPEDAVARSEALGSLQSFLGSLDEGKRTIFVLSELAGERPVDIAEQCDLNVHTVNTRLRRARAEFAATFAPVESRRQRALVLMLPWWRRPLIAATMWLRRVPTLWLTATLGAGAVAVVVGPATSETDAVVIPREAPEPAAPPIAARVPVATLPAVAPATATTSPAPVIASEIVAARPRPARRRAAAEPVTAPAAATPLVTPPPAASPHASTLAAELASLDRIRRSVSEDPTTVPQRIADHRARFPGGNFGPELDALARRAR